MQRERYQQKGLNFKYTIFNHPLRNGLAASAHKFLYIDCVRCSFHAVVDSISGVKSAVHKNGCSHTNAYETILSRDCEHTTTNAVFAVIWSCRCIHQIQHQAMWKRINQHCTKTKTRHSSHHMRLPTMRGRGCVYILVVTAWWGDKWLGEQPSAYKFSTLFRHFCSRHEFYEPHSPIRSLGCFSTSYLLVRIRQVKIGYMGPVRPAPVMVGKNHKRVDGLANRAKNW